MFELIILLFNLINSYFAADKEPKKYISILKVITIILIINKNKNDFLKLLSNKSLNPSKLFSL